MAHGIFQQRFSDEFKILAQLGSQLGKFLSDDRELRLQALLRFSLPQRANRLESKERLVLFNIGSERERHPEVGLARIPKVLGRDAHNSADLLVENQRASEDRRIGGQASAPEAVTDNRAKVFTWFLMVLGKQTTFFCFGSELLKEVNRSAGNMVDRRLALARQRSLRRLLDDGANADGPRRAGGTLQ